MPDAAQNENNTWYTNFYVWLIIVLPLCAVAASLTTVYIAVKNPPQMAVDSYSNIEGFTAIRDRQDARAAELGLTADLKIDDSTDGAAAAVEIVLKTEQPMVAPQHLELQVIHSTLSEQDATTTLHEQAGRYRGVVELPGGSYTLHVTDPEGEWRLSTRIEGRLDRPLLLTARIPADNTNASDNVKR